MLNAHRKSLSDLAYSDTREDGEDTDDDEQDSVPGKLSEDDKPLWLMGTIYKMIKHGSKRFRQDQIWLDELTKPGWRDMLNHFHWRDMNCNMAIFRVPAVINPQTTIFNLHLYQQPLQNSQSLLIPSPENTKCHK